MNAKKAALSPNAIVVLGKNELTPTEQDACDTFGWLIAESGRSLHTTPSAGAAATISAAYEKSKGRAPDLLGRGDLPERLGVIAIIDEKMAILLDERRPGWDLEPDWTIIANEENLVLFVSAIVTRLEYTGRCVLQHEHEGSGPLGRLVQT